MRGILILTSWILQIERFSNHHFFFKKKQFQKKHGNLGALNASLQFEVDVIEPGHPMGVRGPTSGRIRWTLFANLGEKIIRSVPQASNGW